MCDCVRASPRRPLGEKRAQEKRVHTVLESLQQVFPTLDSATLRAAIVAGGDLSAVVNRLLEAQQPSRSADVPSSSVATPAPPPQMAQMEQMEQMDDEAESRLSAEMESSGLNDAAVSGSARASRLTDDANLAAALAGVGTAARPRGHRSRTAHAARLHAI